jgi:hypothetical protein
VQSIGVFIRAVHSIGNYYGWKTSFEQYPRDSLPVNKIILIQLFIIWLQKRADCFHRLAQNYWNKFKSQKKNYSKMSAWRSDYNLMPWTNLTLFWEYLEMGNFLRNIRIFQILNYFEYNNQSDSIRFHYFVCDRVSPCAIVRIFE